MQIKKADQQRRLMSKFTNSAADKVKPQAHDKLNQKHVDMQLLKKQQHWQEKEARRKTNNLQREQYEAKVKGDYQILYPFVTHAEEDFILQKLQQSTKTPVLLSETIADRDELKNIEFVKQLVKEPQEGIDINLETLPQRVVKQLRFEEFIIGAKCLWENLVGGQTKLKRTKVAKQPEVLVD